MQTYTHEQLRAMIGRELALSDWHEITQQRIDQFAEATGDDQWIHVDIERARQGPFGETIAHGYLTLSLIAGIGYRLFAIDEKMAINYGLNKVRFPAPVRAGSRVRARYVLKSLEDFEGGPPGVRGLQMISTVTIELDGSDKPACVAETVRLSFA